MTRFTATTQSQAVISADRSAVWEVLVDPTMLPRLTPLLDRIVVAEGDLWRWEMSRIPVLGLHVAPSFTEQMSFVPMERIDFTHAPPEGRERAAAEGWYHLEEADGGTRLSVRLELCVDLPLPRASRLAVDRVMGAVVGHMGERFSVNLLRHLGATTIA